MLRYQRRHKLDKALNFADAKSGWRDHAYVWLANGSRYMGKMLAFSNAVWLLVRTIFEFSGFYENCT